VLDARNRKLRDDEIFGEWRAGEMASLGYPQCSPTAKQQLFLAMSDSGTHPSFLSTNFSATATSFLNTHEHTLLILWLPEGS
jgi:hypothetical protein